MMARARARSAGEGVEAVLRMRGAHVRVSLRGDPLGIFATVSDPAAGGIAWIAVWGLRSAMRVDVRDVLAADVVSSMSWRLSKRIASEQRERFRKERA